MYPLKREGRGNPASIFRRCTWISAGIRIPIREPPSTQVWITRKAPGTFLHSGVEHSEGPGPAKTPLHSGVEHSECIRVRVRTPPLRCGSLGVHPRTRMRHVGTSQFWFTAPNTGPERGTPDLGPSPDLS